MEMDWVDAGVTQPFYLEETSFAEEKLASFVEMLIPQAAAEHPFQHQ